ncbi:hypothetical protein S40288_11000 [Stachybotrys chartarum IBT 40288]|nr:hypothetical protein S40288_11000 [Stachybotrys chartarum IBT 40288]
MHYSTTIILAAVAYVGAEKVYNTAPGKTLARRQQFCGTDVTLTNWYCDNSISECCSGTFIFSCMPLGAQCCTTGYWCPSTQDCLLDTSTGLQMCITTDGDEVDATGDTGSSSTGDDGGNGDTPDDPDTDGGEEDGSDNSNSDDTDGSSVPVPDAAAVNGLSLGSLVAVAGAAIVLL